MAHCETIRLDDGTVAILRLSGQRKGKPCEFCGKPSGYLCDFILGPRKTCSKAMCEACRTNHGAGVDYCPTHEQERRARAGCHCRMDLHRPGGALVYLADCPLHAELAAAAAACAKTEASASEIGRDLSSDASEPLFPERLSPGWLEELANEDGDSWRKAFEQEPAPAPARQPWQARKAAHVRSAPQSRNHACHWPGCELQVPPAMWGCKRHWFSLPTPVRNAIFRAYKIGQENDPALVSPAYIEAAEAAQTWIREHGSKPWK